MGWYIHEVKNEVVITKEIAYELFETLKRWDFGSPSCGWLTQPQASLLTEKAAASRAHSKARWVPISRYGLLEPWPPDTRFEMLEN